MSKLLTFLKERWITITVAVLLPALLLALALTLGGVTQSRARQERQQLMQSLLPGSEDFEQLDYTEEDGVIRSVCKSDTGYVIETVTQGYASPITMLIGVDLDGYVTGLVVCEAHETSGLGQSILSDHDFLSQFLDSNGSFAVGEPSSDATSGATSDTAASDATYVDGISGATVSSKAVARCVNAAIAYVTGADVDSSATY